MQIQKAPPKKKTNEFHVPNMNFISFEITEICTPTIEATQLVFLP
jgi:hypothetical protein